MGSGRRGRRGARGQGRQPRGIRRGKDAGFPAEPGLERLPGRRGSGMGSESTKSAWALPVRSNVPDAHARPGGRRRRFPGWFTLHHQGRGALLPLSGLTAALVSQHTGPHFIIHNCPA